MFVFVLILLLVAAAAGVLGAVLKVTLVLVLSLVLALVILTWFGVWYAKRRMREFQMELATRSDQARRRRDAYDVPAGDVTDPAGERALGDGA
jgi:hypothetical protein